MKLVTTFIVTLIALSLCLLSTTAALNPPTISDNFIGTIVTNVVPWGRAPGVNVTQETGVWYNDAMNNRRAMILNESVADVVVLELYDEVSA